MKTLPRGSVSRKSEGSDTALTGQVGGGRRRRIARPGLAVVRAWLPGVSPHRSGCLGMLAAVQPPALWPARAGRHPGWRSSQKTPRAHQHGRTGGWPAEPASQASWRTGALERAASIRWLKYVRCTGDACRPGQAGTRDIRRASRCVQQPRTVTAGRQPTESTPTR